MELIASAAEFADLSAALFAPAPAEGAAFLAAAADGDTLRLRSAHVFTAEELRDDEFGSVEVADDAKVRALAAIKRTGLALVEIHTHPGSHNHVQFSAYDREQLPAFARYVQNKIPNQPFGALVLGHASYAGNAWSTTREQAPLTLHLAGELAAMPDWLRQQAPAPEESLIFDRQIRALGPQGQARIASLRVAVVGLGGTGSQVVQQLVHLGVREFLLIDDDTVDPSNLPRLAGATWWDALLRRRKSAIARRTIKRHTRRTTITTTGTLRTQASLQALPSVDLIVGCVDNDGARLILSELAAAYLIPYLDLGVGIEPRDGHAALIGGRVAFHLPGNACLACADELDFAEAAEDLESEATRRVRIERGYARDRRIEPALMPLNTVIVGLGMIELLAYTTGVRPVTPFTRYDATSTTTQRSNVEINRECPVCRPAHALGPRQALDRYAL